MRLVGFVAVLGVVAAGLFGCRGAIDNGTDDGGGPANMRMRLVQLVPDFPAGPITQLYWKARPVSPRRLEYREDSGYQSVVSGNSDLILAVGDLGQVLTKREFLYTDREYTIVASGFYGNGSVNLLALEDNDLPIADKVKVRAFHGTPAVGGVDVYITGPNVDLADVQPNQRSLNYLEASPYFAIEPGAYRIRITPAGTKDVAIDSGSLNGRANSIVTVFATGGGGEPLRGLVLTDRR